MPYKSLAQERYFNANRDKLERQGVDVDEWNQASKGRSLPMKTKTVSLGKKGSFEEHPGALHEALGIPLGEKIGQARIDKAEHSSNPSIRRKAISAKGLTHMHKG